MDAAGEECRRHGYNLLVNAFSDFSAINRAELIDTATTGGVILLGTEIEREDLSYFDGLQKPFVIVDNAARTSAVFDRDDGQCRCRI